MGFIKSLFGQLNKPVPNDWALERQAAEGLTHLAEEKAEEHRESAGD